MSLQIYNDIKGIVHDIIDASSPTDLIGGVVVSEDPLQVAVDLTGELYYGTLLIVPEYLTDHTVEVELGEIVGEMLVKNALKEGDQVIMIKGVEGQKYFILDRVHPE